MLGAVFDWDGVVIDSSRHHEESWNRLAAEAGRVLPEGHFLKGFGMKNEAIIPGILGWTRDEAEIRRLSLRKEVLYREVIRERGIEPSSLGYRSRAKSRQAVSHAPEKEAV